jgi:hypothetical protein
MPPRARNITRVTGGTIRPMIPPGITMRRRPPAPGPITQSRPTSPGITQTGGMRPAPRPSPFGPGWGGGGMGGGMGGPMGAPRGIPGGGMGGGGMRSILDAILGGQRGPQLGGAIPGRPMAMDPGTMIPGRGDPRYNLGAGRPGMGHWQAHNQLMGQQPVFGGNPLSMIPGGGSRARPQVTDVGVLQGGAQGRPFGGIQPIGPGMMPQPRRVGPLPPIGPGMMPGMPRRW